MAGKFFMLVICMFCITTIESDVGSLENFNRLLLQYRKRLLQMRYNPLFRDNLYLPLRNASSTQQYRTSTNQKDSLDKGDSVESKNNTRYHLDASGEYIPTGNPVIDDVSQSTQDNSSNVVISSSPDVEISSTDSKTNQTTSGLVTDSFSTDVITTGPLILSTEQKDISKDTSLSPSDATTLAKEELSSIASDNSIVTSTSTKIFVSTTSSSNEISVVNATSLSSETTETANATDLSTVPERESSSSFSTDISESTTEKTNITVVTTSAEISENLSTTTESTEVDDKIESTTIAEGSSSPTSKVQNNGTEKSTDITSPVTAVNIVSSTTSTEQESSSVEPKEITVTDKQSQSSTKVTGITNGVTFSVSLSSSTNEVVTDTTVTDETRHVIAIYNPTVTTVKLALSIVFMVIAFMGFVVLVVYMVKRQRHSIPYEELSLEP